MKLLRGLVQALKLDDAVCALLGLVAIVVVLANGGDTISLIVLCVVAAVVGAVGLRRVVLSVMDGELVNAAIARLFAARLELTLAIILVAAAQGTLVSTFVALAILGALTALEYMMAVPVQYARNAIAHVPGWPVFPPKAMWANMLAAADLGALIVAVIVVVFHLPALIIWFVVAIGVMCTTILVALGVRYLVMLLKSERRLAAIVDDIKPVFVLHWQAPGGAAYQVGMWLPYLERIGLPFIVVVRSLENFNDVVKLTAAPVFLRVGMDELDPVVCASLRVAFYVNTAVNNLHMIRFPQLRHIQLNHGDSDKIASASPTFRQYDRNFVAGQAAVDRFGHFGVDVDPKQFVLVGRPQLENVKVAEPSAAKRQPPTVLYTPTWSGNFEDSDYCSLSAGPHIVQELLARGCRVVFRPHPFARRHLGNQAACRTIVAMLEADGGDHLYGPLAENTMSIFDCFNESDAMITDVSSVVSDYLVSDKPFTMAAVSVPAAEFMEDFPQARAAYIIDVKDGHVTGLDAALDAMLGDDPMAPIRRSVKEYYLGDVPPERCPQRFIDEAKKFLV